MDTGEANPRTEEFVRRSHVSWSAWIGHRSIGRSGHVDGEFSPEPEGEHEPMKLGLDRLKELPLANAVGELRGKFMVEPKTSHASPAEQLRQRFQMTNHFSTDFFKLAKPHAIAAAALQSLRTRAVYEKEIGEEISTSTIDEARLRSQIIRYQPTSSEEAQMKLLYLVNFLRSTKKSLSDEELSTITESIKHLL